ncbi:Hypothetical protein NTJ_06829 [Nesidiocoris tenuis]|uniref:Uncharacterized protein n=1 Tax=Nesidiocoris tenuis TaxID=355587 RepID=A0ABN7ASZ7_9HEMI|nr:Hypothetical protein NTJ_06829 [Nesidiocoris tenuis]
MAQEGNKGDKMSPLKVSITATIVRHGGEKFRFLNFLTSVTVGSLSQSNDRITLPEPDGLAVASGSTRGATRLELFQHGTGS